MTKRTKRMIMAGALAAILAIGAGAAIAGGALDNEQQAFLDDAAKRLDVTPAQLKSALQGAFADRIDAAVAAGKITRAQGDAMKQRVAENGLPPFGGGGHHGGPGHGGPGHRGPLAMEAVAAYLGLTRAELHAQHGSGKTLAQIAKDQGKTVEGLKKAITDASKAKLGAAVKAGTLTQAQADEMLSRLTTHLDDMVNGTGGHGGMHPGGRGDMHREMHGGGHGFGGPMGGPANDGSAPVPA